MLKRTTREQAARIFPSFVERYPNASALASAREEELRELLRPLGLVSSRVAAFQEIGTKLAHAASFPSTLRELLELRGVGSYSASAVLCIAFGQRVPMVDVNSRRVICRVFGENSAQEFFSLARADMRRLNLALLDFAHYVCKARNPLCGSCPVSARCLYYNELNRGSHQGLR